jgi:hypothetical protein
LENKADKPPPPSSEIKGIELNCSLSRLYEMMLN